MITDVKKEREKKLKRVDGGKEILLRRRKEEKTSFLLSAFRCAAVLKKHLSFKSTLAFLPSAFSQTHHPALICNCKLPKFRVKLAHELNG